MHQNPTTKTPGGQGGDYVFSCNRCGAAGHTSSRCAPAPLARVQESEQSVRHFAPHSLTAHAKRRTSTEYFINKKTSRVRDARTVTRRLSRGDRPNIGQPTPSQAEVKIPGSGLELDPRGLLPCRPSIPVLTQDQDRVRDKRIEAVRAVARTD